MSLRRQRRMLLRKERGLIHKTDKLSTLLATVLGVPRGRLITAHDSDLKFIIKKYGRKFGRLSHYDLYEMKTLETSTDVDGRAAFNSVVYRYASGRDSIRHDRIFLVPN